MYPTNGDDEQRFGRQPDDRQTHDEQYPDGQEHGETHAEQTPDEYDPDKQDPKSFQHGIRKWSHLTIDDISEILDGSLEGPPVEHIDDVISLHVRPKRVEYCPNCGHPVKSLRRSHLKLRMQSAAFRELNLKIPSEHICSRCGLDLRRVIIK